MTIVSEAFVYPVLALVLLTFTVLFTMGLGRVKNIGKNGVHIKKFRLMEGKHELPIHLQQMDRNFSNLLEVPILFYVWSVMVMVMQLSAADLIYLAWGYVVLRFIHTFIHISYNNVTHRFCIYVLSCLLLLWMWVRLLFAL